MTLVTVDLLTRWLQLLRHNYMVGCH